MLFVASVVAMLARKVRIPYAVGLVLAGIGLAATGTVQTGALTRDLIFSIFLPPLIFEAALAIRWEKLRANLKPVLLLATAGVILATLIVGAGMHFAVGWEWPVALLFGSLITATDPVSVIAVFKDANVGGRIGLLVEAESLLNDGVAAVVFGVVLAWASGGPVSAPSIGIDIIQEVVGGCGVGLIVGWLAITIAGKTHDHLVEVTFTVVAAYASFFIATHFHASGVLSTLVCGLLIGNTGSLGSFSDEGREAVTAFWEFGAFVVNSLIFLLIGVQEQGMGSQVTRLLPVLAIGILLVTLSRAFSVYPLSALLNRTPDRIEMRHQHVLFWGGLRGALALALVLGLPADLPHRLDVVTVSFGVVAFSIIVQGITMPILLKKLGIISSAASDPITQ